MIIYQRSAGARFPFGIQVIFQTRITRITRILKAPFTAKLSFTSKRLQRSDKFFAGKKSQIGQNWFNLEISKVYIIFVQHKIIPNGPFHTHQKHQ